MSKLNTNQNPIDSSSPLLPKFIARLQKTLCFLASFDYERYRQMKWGMPKAIITARGVSVIIPSIVIASTLAMWGPAIFGSIGETLLFAVVAPVMVFIVDYALIAQSYSGTSVPSSLNFARVLLLLLSLALNVFVVAGANSGSLLPDIEKEVRQDPRFSTRLGQTVANERANVEELKSLRAEKMAADDASRRLKRLITMRDAEIAGATLSDGVQRVQGNGTKAKGFNLEIDEASQIASGAGETLKRLEAAEKVAEQVKDERKQLDEEIVQEMKKRQSPGLMVSALCSKIKSGNIDVLFSTLMFLFFLVVMDCSALILSHVPTPAGILRMAELQATMEVAVAEFDHEAQMRDLNSRRPHVDVRVSPGRFQNASARVFNMRNEAPGAETAEERMSA